MQKYAQYMEGRLIAILADCRFIAFDLCPTVQNVKSFSSTKIVVKSCFQITIEQFIKYQVFRFREKCNPENCRRILLSGEEEFG